MAQFLLTEFIGLPTLGSIISDISQPIFKIDGEMSEKMEPKVGNP